jgi:uncharacterized membrane protein
MFRILLSTTALFLVAGPALPQSYNGYFLPHVAGPPSAALAINNAGDVVGFANTTSSVNSGIAIEWLTNGTAIVLPNVVESPSAAQGINNAGNIVGFSYSGFGEQAIEWSRGGAATVLPNAGGLPSLASAINSSGDVAGASRTSNNPDSNLQAVEWSRDGTVHLLPNPEGYGSSLAYAINNEGDIVGISKLNEDSSTSVAVEWSRDGTVTVLPNPEGGDSQAYGINNSGDIVGISGFGATEWLPNGTIRALGGTTAWGINDAGDIVGDLGFPGAAVEWLPNRTTIVLPVVGGQSSARAINDAGDIVGFSYTGSDTTSEAAVEWLLASESAVPEPSTWAMMLLGFAGLGFAGYRSLRRISHDLVAKPTFHPQFRAIVFYGPAGHRGPVSHPLG